MFDIEVARGQPEPPESRNFDSCEKRILYCVLMMSSKTYGSCTYFGRMSRSIRSIRSHTWSMLCRPSAPQWIFKFQKWNQHQKLHNFNTGKYILRTKIKKFGELWTQNVCRKCSEDVNRSSAELPGATPESVTSGSSRALGAPVFWPQSHECPLAPREPVSGVYS